MRYAIWGLIFKTGTFHESAHCRLLVYVAVGCVPVQQACETVTKWRATTTKSQSGELACLPAATALSFEVQMTFWPFLKEEKKNSCCGQVKFAVTSLRAPGLRSCGGGCWRCWGDALGASPGLSVQPRGLQGFRWSSAPTCCSQVL